MELGARPSDRRRDVRRSGGCRPRHVRPGRRRVPALLRRGARVQAIDAAGYKNMIDVCLLPAFGSMDVEDVTVQEIERWRSRVRSVRGGGQLSNKSKNRLLVLLHGIFRWAVIAVVVFGLLASTAAAATV